MDVDAVALASPVFAMAVVLLLGFAGCIPPPPPPPPPFLTLRLRAPTALVVEQIDFYWEPPDGIRDRNVLVRPTPSGVEGGDNVFDHRVAPLVIGAWSVGCRVRVQGGDVASGGSTATFILDDSLTHPVATFQASGDPLDLALTFQGLT